jgi:hypothetical protein
MPWHQIVLTGDDQQAYTGRRQKLVNTVSEARLRDGGNKRAVLLSASDNRYLISPEASLLLPDLLRDYNATECEKPAPGTFLMMAGDDDSLRELELLSGGSQG